MAKETILRKFNRYYVYIKQLCDEVSHFHH